MQHTFRMKSSAAILGLLICGWCLAGCGPKLPSYGTESQKFSWGSAYVWMSTRQPDALSGEGYLLINTFYNESVLNKNCAMTVRHVRMTDPDTGAVLIDEVPSWRDGSPATKEIKKFPNGQFSFHDIPFEFERESFPHELKIRIDLNCPNTRSEHEFSEPIRFFMKRPVSMMP